MADKRLFFVVLAILFLFVFRDNLFAVYSPQSSSGINVDTKNEPDPITIGGHTIGSYSTVSMKTHTAPNCPTAKDFSLAIDGVRYSAPNTLNGACSSLAFSVPSCYAGITIVSTSSTLTPDAFGCPTNTTVYDCWTQYYNGQPQAPVRTTYVAGKCLYNTYTGEGCYYSNHTGLIYQEPSGKFTITGSPYNGDYVSGCTAWFGETLVITPNPTSFFSVDVYMPSFIPVSSNNFVNFGINNNYGNNQISTLNVTYSITVPWGTAYTTTQSMSKILSTGISNTTWSSPIPTQTLGTLHVASTFTPKISKPVYDNKPCVSQADAVQYGSNGYSCVVAPYPGPCGNPSLYNCQKYRYEEFEIGIWTQENDVQIYQLTQCIKDSDCPVISGCPSAVPSCVSNYCTYPNVPCGQPGGAFNWNLLSWNSFWTWVKNLLGWV